MAIEYYDFLIGKILQFTFYAVIFYLFCFPHLIFRTWQFCHKMSDSNNQSPDLEPSSKKIKINHENDNTVSENQLELKDFILEKVLNNNTVRKQVCLQGKFRDKSGVALVVLEKNAFKNEDLDSKGFFSVDTELKTFFQNDIYGNYECFPRASINGELLSNTKVLIVPPDGSLFLTSEALVTQTLCVVCIFERLS